ncbi:hypothetical protein PC116_g11790 [Phytophthora cactorum]|nr:hypothetical protein PC114_g9290 [Phytophthora cactorum]KAG3023525.1 hypothetical protein PC119_g8877 [Phytophthora cactorum]KAG4240235.1 hypothetical protein PC116_g11790 [Phytophthora cactorum]
MSGRGHLAIYKRLPTRDCNFDTVFTSLQTATGSNAAPLFSNRSSHTVRKFHSMLLEQVRDRHFLVQVVTFVLIVCYMYTKEFVGSAQALHGERCQFPKTRVHYFLLRISDEQIVHVNAHYDEHFVPPPELDAHIHDTLYETNLHELSVQ